MDNDKSFSLEQFNDAVDASDLRREWEEWLRSFELLMELKQVGSQREKLVLMLARGGRGLQRIYYNLRPVPEEIQPGPTKVPLAPQEIPEYNNAVKRLNNFFVGKRNERVELEVFRSLKQSSDESFSHFILKLRTQAARCDFREREEKEILHQVTMGARDERVKDKGLENVMELDELMNYAINRELLMKQKEKSQSFRAVIETPGVSAVSRETERKPQYREKNTGMRYFNREKPWSGKMSVRQECDCCGSWQHHKDSRNCIARNSRCNNCGRTGHFARKCRAMRKTQLKARTTWKSTNNEAAYAIREENHSDEEPLRRRPKPEESMEVE
ncbi:uncharacterized protein LOC129763275 [Toxorhynchites rutilus septentrionalis]|uniref:uncharacterized protein LOC129763275 n=1 Tax=Toxorhynchites rutilus septentrionalis TaxID=329112 RepID=UPI00247AD154|nr:uncharacterized protein LOC129763275 [Toxorhynchites rutilus septentrionalis]